MVTPIMYDYSFKELFHHWRKNLVALYWLFTPYEMVIQHMNNHLSIHTRVPPPTVLMLTAIKLEQGGNNSVAPHNNHSHSFHILFIVPLLNPIIIHIFLINVWFSGAICAKEDLANEEQKRLTNGVIFPSAWYLLEGKEDV